MRSELKQLLYIQELDLKIRELENDKKNKERDLGVLQKKIEEEEKIVEDEKKLIQEKNIGIKSIDLQVEEKKSLIAKYEQQLFKIKNNKEYQALLEEIKGLKADIKVLEDKILDLMEEDEKNKHEKESTDENLDRDRKQYQQASETARKAGEQIDREVGEITEERKQLAVSLDEELLEKYETILSHKPDKALVAVINGICQGCNMQITAQVVNDLQKGRGIHYCENCGRLIYLPE